MIPQIGYCTNVHAGADLAATRRNLEQHALGVKAEFQPNDTMGIGLWLAAPAARRLLQGDQLQEFAHWLGEVGLLPFTLNGFPYGDFHQPVVKHRVYEPNWFDRQRVSYTQDLIDVLHGLLPPGDDGSISTLPIAWGQPEATPEQMATATAGLHELVGSLARLESDSGRLIYLCLEPEPGCLLDRGEDVVRLFEDHLLTGADEHLVRRHLRVCHDVCHAAVMFEPQAEVLERYRSAGILVGKVQISSAVCLDLDNIDRSDRAAALDQLGQFAEDRYLHQTMARSTPHADPVFHEDLPELLQSIPDPEAATGQWRVHFHVPIYLERFGLLETSRDQIGECLSVARRLPGLTHFEVETYAWGVLPPELRQPTLASGIAREMNWFRGEYEQLE